MAIMQAPASISLSATFQLPLTGNSYTLGNGYVSVTDERDIVAMVLQGFVLLWGGRNNFSASIDPGTGDDISQFYSPGSVWLNTTPSPARAWINSSSGLGAATWIQVSDGSASAGSAAFVNLALTGLLTKSSAAVAAFNGGGQSGATLLFHQFNNVTVAVASSAPYDSVKLPASAPGLEIPVFNSATNPIQVFGTSPDVIGPFATAVGMTQSAGSLVTYRCNVGGNWVPSSIPQFPTQVVYNTNSTTASATLTGANVTGATADVTLGLTGTLTADSNAQLPTVANLVAAIPNAVAGQSYKLCIYNLSSSDFTWTVATNTGWTLYGTMTIDQGGYREFYVTLNNLSAASLQTVGAVGAAIGMGFATPVVYNTNSATSGATLTGANVSGAQEEVTLNLTGTLSADANAQLPTVANLVLAIPDPVIGSSYKLRVMNSSAGDFTWTITTNTGWTLNGTMTIDQGGYREFYVTLTGLTTATLQTIGATGPVVGSGFATDLAYNVNSATSGATLTGANLSGGQDEVTLNLTGTLTGDSNAQLPTVANLVLAIPDPLIGSSYKLRIINSSSANHVWTVTTNTGWTLNGTTTIAQNTWRDFYVTFTSLAAVVLQSIGTGTYS